MNFFDQYDRFYSTSETSPFPHRLNARYGAIIARNVEKFLGKRVLDIASHDGRWSFAALKAGAEHVDGIEPRQELIKNAYSTFSHYEVDSRRYEFHRGDVFDFIRNRKYDIVLCLGFFYHTIRHAELLDLIDRTGAGFVIVDTEVTPLIDQRAVKATNDSRIVFGNPYDIQLLRDPVDNQQMAWSDSLTRSGHTLVGRPSRAAIAYMADHFGYGYESYDWAQYFVSHDDEKLSMMDYYEGWRDTVYLHRS